MTVSLPSSPHNSPSWDQGAVEHLTCEALVWTPAPQQSLDFIFNFSFSLKPFLKSGLEALFLCDFFVFSEASGRS